MDSIRSLLPAALKKRGLLGHALSSLAVTRAQQWLDSALPDCREAVRVRSLKDGVLLVACTHAIAQQEAHQRAHDLQAHLREACPDARVESVRIIRA